GLPFLGPLYSLKYQHARALAHHQSFAVLGERPAFVGCEGKKAVETGESDTRKRINAAANHHIQLALTYLLETPADGVIARGAGVGKNCCCPADSQEIQHRMGDGG